MSDPLLRQVVLRRSEMTSATQDLREDHVFIRRLQRIIEVCYKRLEENKEVPPADISLIAKVIEEFVDLFHHAKEEKGYFPETENEHSGYSEEIRKFVIEHEFGRRIAKRIRTHLDEYTESKSGATEALVRYLRTYSVFIQDHTSKEDKFFDLVQLHGSLSAEQDSRLLKQFETMKNDNTSPKHKEGKAELYRIVGRLEKASWVAGEGK